MALRCTRCDLALPAGTDRCPKCLRTSTVADPTHAASRVLERDDELVGESAPQKTRWLMPLLIVAAQGGLGLGVYFAKQARNTWPPSSGENDVIRWLVVPFFLMLTYATRAVTRDWMLAGAAIIVALVGPLVLEGVAVGLTAALVDSHGSSLMIAAASGFFLSVALAALWAHLSLRAHARRAE